MGNKYTYKGLDLSGALPDEGGESRLGNTAGSLGTGAPGGGLNSDPAGTVGADGLVINPKAGLDGPNPTSINRAGGGPAGYIGLADHYTGGGCDDYCEAETVTNVVDGINVDGLVRTIGHIKRQPGLAKFTFRATNRWVDGTHNRAEITTFYGAGKEDSHPKPLVFDVDEPPTLLGKDLGANPVEYVLIGLSGCLTTSLVANAAVRNIALRSVESRLEGDLDVRGFLGLSDDVRNGYQHIQVTFTIDADATDDQLRELVAGAQQRSPVFDIITNTVPVDVRFERKQALAA